jgi:3' terminal RNA ribose 2'-O-methyltransferase Hen1
LTHTIPLKTLLTHLYVLIPTLDNDKHYYVSEDEINKLLDRGAGWLKEHPEKEQIVKRYLFNVGSLYKKALAQLGGEVENAPPPVSEAENAPRKENLHDKRIRIAAERIVASGATQVIDLGCGEGKLIRQLLKSKQIEKILGMDVVYEELVRAKTRLRWDEMPPHQRARIELIQGSLMYRDSRLKGFDAAAIVEVIEHLELNRLPAFERAVFEFAQPKFVVVTTPNQEFNVTWENLDSENMRHDDHRFEWTRQEFSDWAQRVAKTFHYEVVIEPLGDEVEGIGAPSQMALFTYAN